MHFLNVGYVFAISDVKTEELKKVFINSLKNNNLIIC